jgi:predicted nucleotidyltransferase
LLERLLLNPDESYAIPDLARQLGVTYMAVRRELHRMLDAGIIERDALGRNARYRASVASPLFEPLRELVERSVGVEPLLREILANTEGVRAAAIFGSWARGQVDAESDIDLLVVGDFDYSGLVAALMALQDRAGREISLVAMRPQEFQAQKDSGFMRQVLSEPMLMLIGDIEQI